MRQWQATKTPSVAEWRKKPSVGGLVLFWLMNKQCMIKFQETL